MYCVPKDDASLLACAKCGQEAHRSCLLQLLESDGTGVTAESVATAIDPLGLDCFIYLCGVCKDNVVPKTLDEPKSTNLTTNNSNKPNDQEDHDSLDDVRVSDGSSEVCSFLKAGNCRHGISGKGCKYKHLPLCKKYMNYGKKDSRGCKGNCDKLHPKLCPKSLSKKGCNDKNCSSFYHARRLRSSSNTTTNKTKVKFPHNYIGAQADYRRNP